MSLFLVAQLQNSAHHLKYSYNQTWSYASVLDFLTALKPSSSSTVISMAALTSVIRI